MTTSELVTPRHLARKAMVYIRQSSPNQVGSHQESLRLQYALKERAINLGWRADDVILIDNDLGLTATAAEHRRGFKELIAQVTLGEVGIILSFDVTRLARNCSDWYPLLDLCGYKQCLIADRDGVYDPGSPNGRLLLGLKGQLSELELHTIRARMTAGLLNKAERGELALALPAGLVRDAVGQVTKDANREVQDRLQLVFTTFLHVRSACKTLQFFQKHELLLPRRDRFGDLNWKSPTVASILSILKNPAYAGAFVYGRSRVIMTGPLPTDKRIKNMPMDQWKIRINDAYPAYISWETFERIQAMLQDNYAEYSRNKTRGVPRPGAALLHGITYCGECGHKLVVQYKKGPAYICNQMRQVHHTPVCQNIPADPVDQAVVQAFFQALAPVELDAYARAMTTYTARMQKLDHARQHRLEHLRYEAELARRQFHRVDPDNRLVASELEHRWEESLQALKEAEAKINQSEPSKLPDLPPDLKVSFQDIGQHLPSLWVEGHISQAHKKALLRCLIDKAVIHRSAKDTVEVRIIWKGGDTTTLYVPVTVGNFRFLSNADEMEQIVVAESKNGTSDENLAHMLTAKGFRSPKRNEVLVSTVRIIRYKHGILHSPHQSRSQRVPGYLTVSQIANAIGVGPHWVYDRINNGTITTSKISPRGGPLFPDRPEILKQFKALMSGQLKHLDS
jgi:DNA invertase Pin-like site-specific DNA recombinase